MSRPIPTMYGLRAYSTYLSVIYIFYISNLTITAKLFDNSKDGISDRQKLYQEALACKNTYPGLFNNNANKALRLFGQLIADNSTDNIAKNCAYQLGEWYIIGVPRFNLWKKTYELNIDKSIHYLTLSAKLGHPRSNYLLSFIYQLISLNQLDSPLAHNNNNNCGISSISKTCPSKNRNSINSYENNSRFYSTGKKDDRVKLLLKHLQIAAELGDVMALSTIGYNLLCNNTMGKKSDPKSSSKYYKKAINLIISGKDGICPAYTLESQLPISVLDDENIHFIPNYASKIDIESSMDYWMHKAMQGDALAQYELAKLHEDDKQAEELLSMAANKSHSPALRDLALVYLSRNNIETAVKLLKKASDLGDAESAAILAYILLRTDLGVKKLDFANPTVQMGLKYLFMACKQNIPDALYLLAEILSFNGKFL